MPFRLMSEETEPPHPTIFATQPEMLRHSIRLLLHYLKFWDVPIPHWFIASFSNAWFLIVWRVKVARTLLANYFFMSELSILSLLDIQNSISFSKRATKLQDFQLLSNISPTVSPLLLPQMVVDILHHCWHSGTSSSLPRLSTKPRHDWEIGVSTPLIYSKEQLTRLWLVAN